jgi:hypothetical protein
MDAGKSLLRFARELLQTRVEIVNAIQVHSMRGRKQASLI